ncbi:YitT family protein [Mycoplasmopsis edwardii]|nr:YitT family protein [Mycoplasmopsis edwardii]
MKTKAPRYSRRKIKTSILILGFLYKIHKPYQKMIVLALIAIIASFLGVLFLQNVGLYALGIESLGQAIGNLLYYTTGSKTLFDIAFWVIFFLLNIPLFILSYFKISKHFTYWNIYFIFFYSFSGLAFASIPGIDKVFVFANLDANPAVANGVENIFAFLGKSNIKVVLWNNPTDNFKQVSIFLYAISSALIQSFAIVATLIIGGSTGGFDIYGMYEAKVKSRDIASVFFILNIVSLFIANVLGTYVPSSLAISNFINHNQDMPDGIKELMKLNSPWGFDLFFNPNLIAGIFLILVNAIFVNLTYPKYKLVQTQIYCTNPFELIEQINKASHRVYTFSVHKVYGGYSRQVQHMIVTNTQYLDAAGLFEVTKKINSELFISIIDLKKGDGYMFIEE